MGEQSRGEQLAQLQAEQLETFRKKNADYGDSFAEYGPVGVLIRIGDKLKRLQNVDERRVVLVEDEGVRDTVMDLAIYSLMFVMLLDEEDEGNA